LGRFTSGNGCTRRKKDSCAVAHCLARARNTQRNVKSCWIRDLELVVGDPDQNKATMKVTFLMDD